MTINENRLSRLSKLSIPFSGKRKCMLVVLLIAFATSYALSNPTPQTDKGKDPRYAINAGNIKRVINSKVVPVKNNDGLDISIDGALINIKRPYTDHDGKERGNGIYVDNKKGIILFICIENGYDFVFYKQNENDAFKTMDDKTPVAIKKFTQEMWIKIINEIEKREKR